jgi:trypsin
MPLEFLLPLQLHLCCHSPIQPVQHASKIAPSPCARRMALVPLFQFPVRPGDPVRRYCRPFQLFHRCGTNAAPGAFPSYAIPRGRNYLCGATLIHPDILITAGSCDDIRLTFVRPSLFRLRPMVYIGGTKRDGSDAAETIQVETQVDHPLYSKLYYDFMLVKLKKPSKAPVVPWNTDRFFPETGTPLTVVGFGATVDGGSPINTLKQTELDLVDFEPCKKAYGTELFTEPLNEEIHMCAKRAGNDICLGDAGGPLLTKDGVLVGITSYGEECAGSTYPSVFARVSAADDFIRDGICELSDFPPAYCTGRKKTTSCNTCPGLLWRTGTQLHRKVLGICMSSCFTVIPAFWEAMGWACGPCP